jgi:dCMP deaminase
MMDQSRPSWDEYFLKMAALVAERGTCRRHHVGAIFVRDKRILTTGYNGAGRGEKDCLELGCKKDELGIASGFGSEKCRAIHAEQNAIIQSSIFGTSLKDSKLYITLPPCMMCAKEIKQLGIEEIISYNEFFNKEAEEYLRRAKIEIRILPRPNDKISFKD